MPSGGIDRRAVARMMKDIQREFDKHPIRVPVEVEDPKLLAESPSFGTRIYNGPVIHGNANGAQLAWNSENVSQTAVTRTEQIAPGFEAIAQAVVRTLEELPVVGLPEGEQREAEAAANEVLVEVTQPDPDHGKIRRGIAALKGFLAPIATGLSKGSGDGAQQWAKTAIEQLGTPF
jgi:hypothetical protein